MSADFPVSKIVVRDTTDHWGPFTFDCSNVIFDDTIASVAVTAYLGKVDGSDDLSAETEVSALIDPDIASSTNGTLVSVYLTYPGATYKGEKFTLVITLTLTTNAGVNPLFFHYVKVE